ncbi:MAG: hypothetical protein KGJ03_06385 [Betaproteobacteria bacterium]|nr:hypothetical protein [Betaproteobacteria bacterium]MDE2153005.1 hypothetical protein [Betaproteobacteria bacterium]
MKFTLHFRGALFANGSPHHKHDLRRVFHHQLRMLWQRQALRDIAEVIYVSSDPSAPHGSLIRPAMGFRFAPLVAASLHAVAEIKIMLMRPEAPGNLITQGGDVDNRLKTLFDALTMPRHANQLPPGVNPTPEEEPFFCLLEDDNLITSLQVRTEHLLEPGVSPNHVDLFIDVRTCITRPTMGNLALA